MAYAVRGHVALAAGEPLCAENDLEACTRQRPGRPPAQRLDPCVYEAAEECLPVYDGWGSISKMAEEAVVDPALSAWRAGSARRCGRWCTRWRAWGLLCSGTHRATAPDLAIDGQLEEISEEWLAEKRLGEMGFSIGRFSLESLDEALVVVVRGLESSRSRRGSLYRVAGGAPRPHAQAEGHAPRH